MRLILLEVIYNKGTKVKLTNVQSLDVVASVALLTFCVVEALQRFY